MVLLRVAPPATHGLSAIDGRLSSAGRAAFTLGVTLSRMSDTTRPPVEGAPRDRPDAPSPGNERDRPGVTGDDPPGLKRARRVAHLLDDSLRVPGLGVRVGIDPLIGVLPVGGDIVAAVASLYIVAEAARAGVPRPTLAKMLGLVAIDTVVGSVPLVGVVFDAAWTANLWNVSMLEEHLTTRERV